MNNLRRYFILTALLVTFFALTSISGTADVPNTLNYQGVLTDNTGQPVTGSHQILFNLYEVPAGGTAFWTETQTVQVTNGKFSVALGKTTSLDTTKFTGTTYIGIKVDSGAEMAPRQQLTSVAYALKAGSIFNMPDTIPRGVIVMWSGAADQIPAGWALCDGTNGTPNLRKKFIFGADNEYPVNSTGGTTTKDLSHMHTGPSHAHTYTGTTNNANTEQHDVEDGNDHSKTSAGHTHTYSGTTDANGTGNTSVAGSATQDIMPPYYALAFIMKL
jgi:hypothetical protein